MRAYRQFLMLLVISSLILALLCRLFWLQTYAAIEVVAGKNGIVARSVNQRRAALALDDGRGRIVDRHGVPLAGIESNSLLVLSDAHESGAEEREQIARILEASEDQWSHFIKNGRFPALWRKIGEREPASLSEVQAQRLTQLNLSYTMIVPYIRRYQELPIASHLIGFTAEMGNEKDRVGVAGLERTFEHFLHSAGSTNWTMLRDGRSDPINGLRGRLTHPDNRFYPLALHTTLDWTMQRDIEAMMERMRIEDGAIVVLAVDSGDIAAMAVKPDYNPYEVIPEHGLWKNTAVSSAAPGSVFKTVVAAAALEEGLAEPGERFRCDGEWHGHQLRCSARQGHGVITLEQAYALSCNVAFAQLAVRLGAEKLEQTALKLGIGQTIRPFRQLDGEEQGQVFDPATDREDIGVLAQTGIGQHDVRMSPLQGARIAAIIARGGMNVTPRAVSEVRMKNGRTLAEFPVQESDKRILSGRTAAWLSRAMRLTVESGTARALSDTPGGAGGKTGTAEIGSGDNRTEHHWFIGYAPADAPKYAFAVLVRNQPPNTRHRAAPVAESLVRLLIEQEKN